MEELTFAEKFERFLERYRKPDGSRWANKEIEEATGGFVNRNYVTNLKKGRIGQPSRDRLKAIAEVMGFPDILWYQHDEEFEASLREESLHQGVTTLAEKLDFLFDFYSGRGPKGGPLTTAEVSRLTFGKVSQEDLEKARSGQIEDLHGEQYRALSRAFGVDVSYWYSQPGDVPPLDRETLASLGDEDLRAVIHKLHDRPKGQKKTILSLLDQLRSDKEGGEDAE